MLPANDMVVTLGGGMGIRRCSCVWCILACRPREGKVLPLSEEHCQSTVIKNNNTLANNLMTNPRYQVPCFACYHKERISCGTSSGSHSLVPVPITMPAPIAPNKDPDCPGVFYHRVRLPDDCDDANVARPPAFLNERIDDLGFASRAGMRDLPRPSLRTTPQNIRF